ncbi:MAG: ATP-binding protein, partial [Pirellulaceae bacterium]|nr:ATP-binding protein [Pirellulaceae bacterium]
LDHCRLILNRLSGWAGHAVAEGMTSTPVGVIVEEVVVGLRTQETVAVQLDDQTADLTLITPLEALAQAIRGLVQNAIDASPAGELVDLSVRADDSEIVFVVRDRGEGMSPQTLDRLGEPFFTTKEVGQGMGLGVFLSRNVIELLGGRLEFSSELAVGTAVEVRLQRQLEREG